jgi:hypothetical protein
MLQPDFKYREITICAGTEACLEWDLIAIHDLAEKLEEKTLELHNSIPESKEAFLLDAEIKALKTSLENRTYLYHKDGGDAILSLQRTWRENEAKEKKETQISGVITLPDPDKFLVCPEPSTTFFGKIVDVITRRHKEKTIIKIPTCVE